VHANELFNSKQGNRSFDDFCAYMQNLAREVEADEHMLIYAAMNGLNNEIKKPCNSQVYIFSNFRMNFALYAMF